MNVMAFRVAREGMGDGDFILREGLSIGCEASNAIVIDEPGVFPVHAVVSASRGYWRIESQDEAVLMLPHGIPASVMGLEPGAIFIIGSAIFECIVLHVDEAVPVEALVLPERCPQCQAALAILPGTARFCPRCGGEIMAGAAHDDVVASRPTPAGLAHQPAANVLNADLIEPDILIAYAAAMNSLGRRYETGVGARFNDDEAIRCYLKAARLGNESAKERLAARGIELDS